jgi:hypothetical protein
MAKLPDSTAFGQRATPRPSLDVVETRSGDVARAMSNLGQTLAEVGEEVGKKEDEQAVFEARRKLDEWERKAIYDPTSGVVAKRGADALNLPGQVTKDFDTFAGEVGQTLGSNRQRKIFQDMAQSRRNQVADFTVRHATQQKEVYERGQLNADMASSSDRAVDLARYGNLNGAKAELDTSGDRLVSFLKSRGASGEEVSAALKEHTSKTHFATVAALVNAGKPMDAQQYMEANGGGMRSEESIRAAGLLKEGTLRAKSQAFADTVMTEGLSMSDALAKARTTFTGDEEVAATHEIKTRYAEKEAGRAQTVKQLSTEGWSVVVERGTKGLTPALTERLRIEAPEELRQMRDWEQAKWRQAKADAEGKDQDPATFYGLRMMAAENPEQFGKLDLLKSQPLMSKQHWNHLVELQAGISKGDMRAMESQRVMKSTISTIKNEILAAGIDLTPKEGTSQAKQTAAFFGTLNAALDEATVTKGKPLTSEEARRIGMSMLRDGIEQGSGVGGFFQTKRRGYQIATDPNIKPGASFIVKPYGDIPAADRDSLLREIYPNGAPKSPYGGDAVPLETRAEIERMYTRGLNAGKFK